MKFHKKSRYMVTRRKILKTKRKVVKSQLFKDVSDVFGPTVRREVARAKKEYGKPMRLPRYVGDFNF